MKCDSSLRWRRRSLPIIAVCLPLVMLALLRMGALSDGETCHDVYYHVGMANLGPRSIVARQFPHVTMSLWEHNFANKELLFHLLLWGLRGVQTGLGGSPAPPFHLPMFVLVFGVLAAFVWTAQRLGVRDLVFFSILLVTISPLFALRILMLRPHTLAIALILLATGMLLNIKTPRQLWQVVLAGGVFAWSYSNPHIILLPVLAVAAIQGFKRNFRLAFGLVAAALAGILIGYTVHPQFPHTFMIWKVQCVDVVERILAGATPASPVLLGTEMYAPGTSNWLRIAGVGLLGLVNYATILCLWWRRILKPRQDTVAVLMMSLVTLAGLFFSLRTIEYACPITVLGSALLWRDARRLLPVRSRRLVSWTAILVVLAVLSAVTPIIRNDLKYSERRPFTDVAVWMNRLGLKDGTVIANVNWSDFPLLFYAAPRFRYLTGLDPAFAYSRFPKRTAALERFRTGKHLLPPAELEKIVHTKFIFVSRYMPRLANDMYNMGYRIVYQGVDGWMFYLASKQEAPK